MCSIILGTQIQIVERYVYVLINKYDDQTRMYTTDRSE